MHAKGLRFHILDIPAWRSEFATGPKNPCCTQVRIHVSPRNPLCVLLTGGSRGLGKAMARELLLGGDRWLQNIGWQHLVLEMPVSHLLVLLVF